MQSNVETNYSHHIQCTNRQNIGMRNVNEQCPTISHRYQMSHHQEYQSNSLVNQQQQEQQQEQLQAQNILDSNHNYASDLRYYTPQQTQLDLFNNQCIVDDQRNKDNECIGQSIEQYSDHDMAKYQEQQQQSQQQSQQLHQQQQQPSQQQHNPSMEQVSKGDDDFSVIFADVRKTCYSSYDP